MTLIVKLGTFSICTLTVIHAAWIQLLFIQINLFLFAFKRFTKKNYFPKKERKFSYTTLKQIVRTEKF